MAPLSSLFSLLSSLFLFLFDSCSLCSFIFGDHNLESCDVKSETLTGLLPLPSEEIFVREKEHLPKYDYLHRLRSGNLDLSVRGDALDWIFKEEKSWTVQLLAVACLSLAAKMDEIEVPLLVNLQVGDPKFLFKGNTIKRMELLVLSTLKWRMQVCIPCSFIDYFLKKIRGDKVPLESLITRSIQLILSTIKVIDFLEFGPSEIAAAVAICVSRETEAVDIDRAITCFIHVDKVRVLKCIELIQDLKLMSDRSNVASGGGAAAAAAALVPQSPAGVLEAAVACLSYKSDERTVGSCLNSSHTSPDTKRIKLDTTTQ